MGQQGNKSSSPLSSTIEIAVFLVVIVLIQIPMIYQAGSDQVHTDNAHPLDQVFQSEANSKILKNMLSDKDKYILIEGDAQSGVVNFIRSFASLEKSKRSVLIRQYIQDPYQPAFVAFRYAKNLVQDQFDLQGNNPKTWVLFGLDKEIPKQDINQIKFNNPLDKIIIVSPSKIKIKGFKNYKFTPLKIDQLKAVITQQLQVSQRQAEILIHHYNTIPQIFQNLNEETYSHSANLGQANKDLSKLGPQQQQIVISLCQTGKANAKNTNQILSDIGVVFYQKKFYWESDQARLNYQIKTLSQCQHTVVPDDILQMIYEQGGSVQQTVQNEEKSEDSDQGQGQDQKKDKIKKNKKKKDNNQNEEQQEQEQQEKKKEKKKKEKKKKNKKQQQL